MKTVVSVETLADVKKEIERQADGLVPIGEITIEPYCDRPDNRIQWERTCIVLNDGHPIGFTDSMLDKAEL